MKITWYGHACFGLSGAEGSVIFDPYAPGSVPGLVLPALTADMVLCSHYHRDHGCTEAVRLSGIEPKFKVSRFETFHDDQSGKLRGENTVSAVDMDGMRVVHMGDIGHMLSAEQLSVLGRVDVLMIPVGGFYTVDAQTAHKIVSAIKPRIVIPMHYRGKDFGYDVISTVDEFVRISENVRFFDTNELEISAVSAPMTAILKCPLDTD